MDVLKREDKSKDIIKNFSIIEKWNQIETIKTFESAKGFALEWANKCRTSISMN